MKATEILAIPLTEPGRLFTGVVDTAKAEYRQLAKQWHPDHAGGDGAVFAHISSLYDAAVAMIMRGDWHAPGLAKFGSFEITYRRKEVTELGEVYLGSNYVTYAYTADNRDLRDNAVEAFKLLRFPDKAVEKESARSLPKLKATSDTADRHLLVLHKRPALLRLRDVRQHFGGRLDPKHVAWIVSSMYSLGCYLQHIAKVAHGDVSMDSYFIDPADHSGALLGGWGFAKGLGRPLAALPGRALGVGLGRGLARPGVTATLIRATGLELLGGVGSGSNLLKDKTIPQPMLTWLRGVGTDDSIEEYRQWTKVLLASFGKRRFHEMKLTEEELYP